MVMILPRVLSIRVPGCVFVKGFPFSGGYCSVVFFLLCETSLEETGVFPKSSHISENKQFRVTIDVGDSP